MSLIVSVSLCSMYLYYDRCTVVQYYCLFDRVDCLSVYIVSISIFYIGVFFYCRVLVLSCPCIVVSLYCRVLVLLCIFYMFVIFYIVVIFICLFYMFVLYVLCLYVCDLCMD